VFNKQKMWTGVLHRSMFNKQTNASKTKPEPSTMPSPVTRTKASLRTIAFDTELETELEALAREEERPFSQVVNRKLREAFKLPPKRQAPQNAGGRPRRKSA
jgi:hypothetical protein